MTLDETIKEFTDWAKDNRKEQNFWAAERDENDETNPLSYADCEGLARDAETRAEYHEQLAEWLTDYKELKNSIGAVKLSDIKEALELIQDYKADYIEQKKLIAEYKRLLKSAIDEWHIVCEWGDCSERCDWFENGKCTQEWRYKAEALKLIES